MPTWFNVLTQLVAPLIFTLLTLYLGHRMKQGDELRSRAREADVEHRARVELMLQLIQTQNAWFARKMIEIVTTHNINHPQTKISVDDYPESIGK
jgi:phosphoglycerate-specific signal transduction histidine kinase